MSRKKCRNEEKQIFYLTITIFDPIKINVTRLNQADRTQVFIHGCHNAVSLITSNYKIAAC